MRSADAAGVAGVVITRNNSCPLNDTVAKVAVGALETVAIYEVGNLSRAMQAMQQVGFWLIGTSDKADGMIYETDLTAATAIVMGSEDTGIRPLTATHCDQLVSLPMAGDVVTSLNVSVATGVCLFEAVRQRLP